jgi:apolipoprotein N-acyltransferase
LTASIQSASLFGSLFVSFLVALVNAMFGMGFYYFFQVDRHARQIRVFPLLAIAILLFNFGYGLIKIGLYTEEDDGIVVALIQGNIGSDEKWENEQITNVLEIYEDLTRQAVAESGAQIVLFPETAINYSLNLPSRQKERQRLSDLAVQENILLFVGTFDCQSSTDEEEVLTYNAIVAFFPNGEIEEIPYYKRHLVPFGEYVPMETFFRTCMPFLAEMNLFDGTLEAGEDPAILETEFGSFGRLICYDSIYESLSRDSVANGAEILLLSTNDSWYKDSPAVYMHNAHSKLRAVENGRYVLRAANTGVSSIINPLGETEEELGPLLTGYVTGKVHFSSERTLYSYIGDSFIFVCFGVILVESFLKIRQYRQKRETNHDISKGLGR